jgi:tRNA(Arg) A34 adenosine deaminase TadA
VSDVPDTWDALADPWRLCLSLAWEAFGVGTIPVGAVLVDADGTVIATGRNRVYDRASHDGQLARSLLAHAEVNALVGLDPDRRYRDHVLYSSLEPCLLCVGATHRATVGTVRYAGAEPFRGAAPWRGRISESEAQRAQFNGPLEGPFGVLAAALPVAFNLYKGDRSYDFIEVYEHELPAVVTAGRRLVMENARDLAARGISLADALPSIWGALAAA